MNTQKKERAAAPPYAAAAQAVGNNTDTTKGNLQPVEKFVNLLKDLSAEIEKEFASIDKVVEEMNNRRAQLASTIRKIIQTYEELEQKQMGKAS